MGWNLPKKISSQLRSVYRCNRFFCNVLLAWMLLFCLLRTLQHYSFATNAWDLSIFDYAMSSTLWGDIMAEPFHGFGWGSHLAIHFTPVLFLLVPLYLVFSGPLFLLYVQVLAVGLAAIPLYLAAKHKLQNKKMALAAALIFLSYRPLLNGLMYDFHPEMFFPLFIFSSYYFVSVRDNRPLFFLFVLLAVAIKEDFAVYTFFYCLWLALGPEKKKIATRAMLLSALYILFTFSVFIPHFRGQVQAGQTYEFISKWRDYGNTPVQIIARALAEPKRLLKDLNLIPNLGRLANFFLPLLFIPLGSSAVLLILPPLAVALGSRIPAMASFGLHYAAAVIPFLFLAWLLAWERLQNGTANGGPFVLRCRRWLVMALLLVNLVNFKWNLFSPGQYRFSRDFPAVRHCLGLIPKKASVASQSALIPHIPKRRAIAMLPAIDRAEYILLHLGLNPWPMPATQLQELDARLQQSGEYDCRFRSGDLRLYKKSYAPEAGASGQKQLQ